MHHHLRRATTAVLGTLLLVPAAAATAMAETTPVGTTTHITCNGPVTYTGAELRPCTATVTAKDSSMTWTVPVSYNDNVDAGTAHVSAGLLDVSGYAGSYALGTFTIVKASTSASMTCPASVAYTGQEIEPCTATLTYDGQVGDLSIMYVHNVDPGKALAYAMFPGDQNHVQSGASGSFIIGTPTTVTVSCTDPTYTGAPLTPCTATATAGTWSTPVDVTYTDNVNAGKATATATYAGDGTHQGATATTTFTIGKAPFNLGVSCFDTVYTGAEVEPCFIAVGTTGQVTGKLSITYDRNINVGTGSVTLSFPGDANHLSATASATFGITPASSVVTVACPATADFTGAPVTPCTATVTGAGGLSTTATVTYGNNVYTGTATATASYAGDANHLPGTGSATFQVKGFSFTGYTSPVAMGTTANPVWNTVKAGSTVPLKFEAFLPNGTEITSTAVLGATFTTTKVACPTATNTATVNQSSSDATGLRYDAASGQFIQNWKTPKTTGCYQVTTTTVDHSTLSALFVLR